MTLNDSMKKEKRGLRAARWVPLGILVFAIAVVFIIGADGYLSLSFLVRNYVATGDIVRDNFLLALLAFGFIYITVAALSIPGALVLTVAGGLFFGGLIGGSVIVFCATAGATLVFLIARSSLGESLRERAGPLIGRLRKDFQDDAVSYLLFLRLVPAFPFWLVNLAPALFGVKLSIFVLTTFIGIIPGTFAYSFVGAGIHEIVAAQARALAECEAAAMPDCAVSLRFSDFINIELIIAFSVLGVVALLPALYRRFGRGRFRGKA